MISVPTGSKNMNAANNPYAAKARELVKAGYTPLPLVGKKPCPEGWSTFSHVTEETLTDWERRGWFQNIGMLCGAASNNVVVLDFDGLAGYDLFCQQFPDLVETLTVATGSGAGKHCYYKVDLLPDSKPVKDILLKFGERVNIEIRADGLQVVIPPSIHPDTKQPYTIEKRLAIMHLPDMARVVQWVLGLKPDAKPEWKAPTYSPSDKPLNPKLLSAVEQHFLSRPHKMHRDWINASCPNAAAHKHGDQEFSFGYHPQHGAGYCFVCEGMNLKELCGFIGIDPASYGGIYEKQEPAQQIVTLQQKIVRTNGSPSNGTSHHENEGKKVGPEGIPVVTRSSRLSVYSNRIYDFDTPRELAPIPFPLKALWKYGGMARVLKPGWLVGIVGVSSGGKTTLLESMVDAWLGHNVASLIWSPEWDADDFVARAIQRYGGATTEELMLHELYIAEKQRGIPNGAGREMSAAAQKASSLAIRTLRGWTDETGYLDCPFLTIGYLQQQLEATLKAMTFQPRVLFIDYVQLLHAMEANADLTMYNLLMRIKALCKAYNLLGVVATQVTKDSARQQTNGQVLDALSARYVNDDAFNLFITVNPERNPDGSFQPTAILNVTKNSYGGKGKVRVGVNWQRLIFSNEPHPNQSFQES